MITNISEKLKDKTIQTKLIVVLAVLIFAESSLLLYLKKDSFSGSSNVNNSQLSLSADEDELNEEDDDPIDAEDLNEGD